MKPYGPEVAITKLECVGHVQNGWAQLLGSLRANLDQKKLSDGKSIEGYGRLTDKRIDKLQIFYGLAIKRNKGDLTAMRK